MSDQVRNQNVGFLTTWLIYFTPIFRFWAGPIVVIVAMYAIALWSREKTVVGVENFVSLCGHIFFLVSITLDCSRFIMVVICILINVKTV